MSVIIEQVKELREVAKNFREWEYNRFYDVIDRAADTIEYLSANLEEANEELKRWHTDKINEKIKNPFVWTSTLCCCNCDHKDEYIEELEAADMGRSAEDCGGGWIPCKDRLPDKSGEYIVMISGAELPTCLHFLSSDNSWFDMEKDYKVSYWRHFPKPPHHEP